MTKKKDDSGYLNTCLEKEDRITQRALRQLKKENEFYKRSFDLLYDLTSNLYDLTFSKVPSRGKFAILAMQPRLLGSLRSVRILGLKGYHYDVAILERSIIENIGLCAYFATHEEEAMGWLTGKKISIPKIRLTDEIVSFLTSQKVKEFQDGKAVYGRLSDYVHNSVRAIARSFLSPSPSNGKLKFDVEFPPRFRKEKTLDFSAYSILLLFVLIIAFKEEIDKKLFEKMWAFIEEYVADAKSTQPE